MKELRYIILIFLLTASSIAGDLASSFEQASAIALAQRKDPAVQAYGKLDLMPYYQQKYVPIFHSCLRTTEQRDTSPFVLIAAIGKDGHVLRAYSDHETNIFGCVRRTLETDVFPRPPVSPFYMRIAMNFDNGGADDTPTNSSFKHAVALADAQDGDPSTQEYVQRDLNPYYLRKYGPVFNSCLASTDHPDKSPFSFIAAIGKNGRVVHLYVDHQTNIFTCVQQTIEKDEFPHPPVAPYYMHMSMSFSR